MINLAALDRAWQVIMFNGIDLELEVGDCINGSERFYEISQGGPTAMESSEF